MTGAAVRILFLGNHNLLVLKGVRDDTENSCCCCCGFCLRVDTVRLSYREGCRPGHPKRRRGHREEFGEIGQLTGRLGKLSRSGCQRCRKSSAFRCEAESLFPSTIQPPFTANPPPATSCRSLSPLSAGSPTLHRPLHNASRCSVGHCSPVTSRRTVRRRVKKNPVA